MTTFFFGSWTDDEKDEILLVEAERMRHINNPALRMSDKEHHDFMVILIDFFYLIFVQKEEKSSCHSSCIYCEKEMNAALDQLKIGSAK